MRVAVQIALKNRKDRAGELIADDPPEDTFVEVLVNQAASRKGRFIFDEEPNARRDWPVRDISAFEAEFIATQLRPCAPRSHTLWAKRLATDKRQIGAFFLKGVNKRICLTLLRGGTTGSPRSKAICTVTWLARACRS